MFPYPSILHNILVILVRRPYEMIVRYLGLTCKVLVGCEPLAVSWACGRVAYSEDICALVAEGFEIGASFSSSLLDLLVVSASQFFPKK
jgi:hypothetical protein